jgi:molecular chaperone GrpE
MPKRHKIEITSDNEAEPAPEQAWEAHEAEALAESVEERVRRLEQQLAEAQRRAEELNDKYLRALADLENLRRRSRHERANAARDGEAAILLEVLPLLDNFARAMAAAQDSNDSEALMQGVGMAYDQLHAALARKGVRPIEAEGQPFDPQYHDAVGRLETTQHPEGSVAVEIQKGYMLGDRVLRPSRVMVAVRSSDKK